MKEVLPTTITTPDELYASKSALILERYFGLTMPDWKKRLPRTIIERLVDYFAYPLYVKGIENLDATQNLIMERKKIVMLSNHLSWADPPVTMAALKRNGFEEMAEMTTIIAGIKLHTDPVRNLLGAAYDVIPIWSPFTEPKNQEEKEIRFEMHKKALIKTEQTLETGRPLLTYPEATRSRTQELVVGRPEITHYLARDLTKVENTFVVPTGIYGTEKILPVGALLPDVNSATVVFGEPIEVAMVVKMFKYSPRETRRQLIMNYFMYRIADCLPEKYHGVYAKTYAQT
ncbi:MAG: lysophospholipid acyltransferase family protein [Patescibacteria group bacterium]